MTTTITALDDSARSSTPLFIHSTFTPTRESRNLMHDLLSGDIAIALRGSRPRANQLVLYYPTEVSAKECVDLHAAQAAFTLVTDEADTADMTYVMAPGGRASYRLDPETKRLWIVELETQEIVP